MKQLKKIQGDQLPIDELLPEVDAIGHKPVKKPLKKRPLYRVRKSNPQENRTNTSSGANGEFGQNRTLSLKVFSCMTYRIL